MTAPTTIRSGCCGAGWHGRCVGSYSGCACDCDCHSAPPEPEPEPRRVQVRRSEVWRTDPDGSWRVIGLADRTGHPSEDAAVLALLAQQGIDPGEYGPPWPPA